jgi:hypothetical protein
MNEHAQSQVLGAVQEWTKTLYIQQHENIFEVSVAPLQLSQILIKVGASRFSGQDAEWQI